MFFKQKTFTQSFKVWQLSDNSKKIIHYLNFQIPITGKVTEITSDIFWIRMPLPFKLDHINLWLFRDVINKKPGWTLIDTGLFNKKNKIVWKSIIRNYFSGLELLRVICTHMHPDHIGLANWLCRGLDDDRWSAELLMSHGEFFNGRTYSLEGKLPARYRNDSRLSHTSKYFHSHGCDVQAEKDYISERSNYYSSMVPDFPSSFEKLSDKQQLQIGKYKWTVITGSGHSPEHISLYNSNIKLLISGDMLLPKISSHVGVFPDEPNGNPLNEFLKSLNKFTSLPIDTMVLPSHGEPFLGIVDRVNQLKNHHDKRMKKIFLNCLQEKTAYQLIPNIFSRKLDSHQFFFAFCEIIAHLNYGWHMNMLSRSKQKGIIKFKTIN